MTDMRKCNGPGCVVESSNPQALHWLILFEERPAGTGWVGDMMSPPKFPAHFHNMICLERWLALELSKL